MAVDLQLVWLTETNLALGFATKDDLMLGDTLVSKNLKLDSVIDEAWAEIEARLGIQYETPIGVNDLLPHHTVQFLTRLHAYVATSIAVLGQGGANPDVIAYSQYLRDRAEDLFIKVVDAGANLDGLIKTSNDVSDAPRAPVILTLGQSPLEWWESEIHGNLNTRTVWRPHAYTDPNAA